MTSDEVKEINPMTHDCKDGRVPCPLVVYEDGLRVLYCTDNCPPGADIDCTVPCPGCPTCAPGEASEGGGCDTSNEGGDHEPGELIHEMRCPVCNTLMRIEHGDDPGEIGVVYSVDPANEYRRMLDVCHQWREAIEKAEAALAAERGKMAKLRAKVQHDYDGMGMMDGAKTYAGIILAELDRLESEGT